jgi:hypothetical protein
MRERLPARRKHVLQRLKIGGQTVHFSVGLYQDGRPGELFIDMHKTGTAVKAWCESTAKLVSLMLQHGVPLSEVVESMVGHCTEAFGRVPVQGHPLVSDTSGVLDAILRVMAQDYLAAEREPDPVCPVVSFMEVVADLEAPEIIDLVDDADRMEEFTTFLGKFT